MTDDELHARLVGWGVLVGVLAVLAYLSRIGGDTTGEPLYRYDTALAALLLYAIVLGIVLAMARGAARVLLALRRPPSWARAAGLAFLVLVSVIVLGQLLEPLLHAGKEQGLAPTRWESRHAGAFAANVVVVAGIAPVVEELTYRGLGFSLVARYGRGVAIAAVGIAFGLAHGLVVGLPILAFFGMALAWLRSRTDSVYPGILVHAAFNGLALAASVTS